ncbi:MAG: hypothetical protein E7041_07735 [Lentisphaerae bacterium]|nr:hypothetical protein [Lentisphaerota bacterium]
MADIISGATFFAPADLGNSLTENGVLVAGQSFTGSYGGTVADLGTYPNVTVIVGSEITNPPLKHTIGSSQKLAYKDTKISGGIFAFSGTGTGGGLHMVDGYLYMDNTSVSDCIMTGMGSSSNSARGIIYVSGNKHADLNDVVFSGNSTRTGSGYLIWNAKGYLNVTGCTFTENIGSGSMFYANSAGNVFTDTLFSYNLGGKVDDGVISISASGAVFNAQSDGELTFNGCTFTGNTATDGGAVYLAESAAGVTATDTYFIDNMTTSSGGAAYIRCAASEFKNCYFGGNTSSNGGALRIYHTNLDREVTLTGCTFEENIGNNGGALYSAGNSTYTTTVNFTDCKFLTVSDTIYANSGTKQVIFNFAGNNTVNGKIHGYAIVNVADDTKFTFDNDSEISISGLTFAGGATMNFTGSKKVTFAKDQLFTGINVTIDATDYMTAGTYTIAENAGGLDKNNISLTQNTKAPYLKSEFGYADNKLTLTVTDTSTQAALCDPSIEVGKSKVVKVDGVYYSGENYATIHDAMAAKTVAVMNGGNFTGGRLEVGSGKTVVFNDIVASGLSKTDGASGNKDSYGLVCKTTDNATVKIYGGTFSNNTLLGDRAGNLWNYNGGSLTIDRTENGKGTLFTQNVCSGIGAAIFNQSTGTVADVTGATFSCNQSGGAAVYSNGVITITDSLFDRNLGLGQDNKYKDGAALGIYSGTANLTDVEFTGNTGNYGGAIYAGGGTSVLDNVNIHDNEGKSNGGGIHCRGNMTITNSQFEKNKGSNGGAFYLYHGSDARTAAISATTFTGNTGSNGGAIYAAVNMTITIDGCVFDSNTAINSGGAIYNNGSITVTDSEFKTATDTIYNAAAGTLTFGGNITLNAALGGDGTYVIAKDTVFTNAVDLSAVNITVNSALYDGSDVTIATGVAAIGAYTLDNKELMLKVSDNKLILTKMAEIALEDEKTVTGTANNLITSGTAENFISNKTTAADNLLTTIKGGAISNALVGGAYANADDDGFDGANIGSVELNISDLADIAGKVYAGGYLYGNAGDSEAADEAQMTVGEVNVNLTSGTVGGNLYGGVHARQNGNASVTEVNITVTDGSHSRIYAGGWAEKGAVSSVESANVIISGGTVDYLYGGGANADGTTTVGSTTITIENDALVNTVFMSGRYGYSSVSDTVTLNYNSNTGMKRLSGVSSAGVDNALHTVVNVLSDLTADLIDYVDKFVIKEGCMLTANDAFYLGNRLENGETAGVTIFDFIADGEANWTAVAGISDFNNAKFAVNGIEGSEWIDDVMAIGDYTLTRSDADKDGKYIIAITK